MSFKPEDFFYLTASVSVFEKSLVLKWNQKGCKTKEEANAHFVKAKVDDAELISLIASEKQKKKPCGMNTVELLKASTNYIGIGSHDAMKIAESLYLRGYITYPRTESTNYSPNFDFKSAIKSLEAHPILGKFASNLCREGFFPPKDGHNAGDHPPITPVCMPSYSSLNDRERKYYIK